MNTLSPNGLYAQSMLYNLCTINKKDIFNIKYPHEKAKMIDGMINMIEHGCVSNYSGSIGNFYKDMLLIPELQEYYTDEVCIALSFHVHIFGMTLLSVLKEKNLLNNPVIKKNIIEFAEKENYLNKYDFIYQEQLKARLSTLDDIDITQIKDLNIFSSSFMPVIYYAIENYPDKTDVSYKMAALSAVYQDIGFSNPLSLVGLRHVFNTGCGNLTVNSVVNTLVKKRGTAWMEKHFDNFCKSVSHLAESIESGNDHPFIIACYGAIKTAIFDKNKRAINHNPELLNMALNTCNVLYNLEDVSIFYKSVYDRQKPTKNLVGFCNKIAQKAKNLPYSFYKESLDEAKKEILNGKCSSFDEILTFYTYFHEELGIEMKDAFKFKPEEAIDVGGFFRPTFDKKIPGYRDTMEAQYEAEIAKPMLYTISEIIHTLPHAHLPYSLWTMLFQETAVNKKIFKGFSVFLASPFIRTVNDQISGLIFNMISDTSYNYTQIEALKRLKKLEGFDEYFDEEQKNFSVGKTFLGSVMTCLGKIFTGNLDYDAHHLVDVFITQIATSEDIVAQKKILLNLIEEQIVTKEFDLF